MASMAKVLKTIEEAKNTVDGQIKIVFTDNGERRQVEASVWDITVRPGQIIIDYLETWRADIVLFEEIQEISMPMVEPSTK